MNVMARLHAIRKLIFRRDPYIMIAIKPPEMLRSLPATYCYDSVRQRLDTYRERFYGTLSALMPVMQALHHRMIEAPQGAKLPLENNYFGGLDALAAHAMVVTRRPRRIVEVGSGYSTMFLRQAIEDEGLDTEIVCIDPRPRTDITSFADRIHYKSVLDVDLALFSDLGRNDFLFIDGSHYVFSGTDVSHVFLNILPQINSGVIVHFHDIMLPYEYIGPFRDRYYNEQYMLATLLLFSDLWEPLLPVYYLRQNQDILDGYEGASFWMRRT